MIEEQTRETSFRVVSLEAKQASMEDQQTADIAVLKEQQVGMGASISDTVELIKQVSDDQKDHGKKIIVLEETKRQLSEEVEKTGEIIRQLSIKDEKMQSEVEDLKENVADIKYDIVKVKEEIDEMQQKGIVLLGPSFTEVVNAVLRLVVLVEVRPPHN